MKDDLLKQCGFCHVPSSDHTTSTASGSAFFLAALQVLEMWFWFVVFNTVEFLHKQLQEDPEFFVLHEVCCRTLLVSTIILGFIESMQHALLDIIDRLVSIAVLLE